MGAGNQVRTTCEQCQVAPAVQDVNIVCAEPVTIFESAAGLIGNEVILVQNIDVSCFVMLSGYVTSDVDGQLEISFHSADNRFLGEYQYNIVPNITHKIAVPVDAALVDVRYTNGPNPAGLFECVLQGKANHDQNDIKGHFFNIAHALPTIDAQMTWETPVNDARNFGTMAIFIRGGVGLFYSISKAFDKHEAPCYPTTETEITEECFSVCVCVCAPWVGLFLHNPGESTIYPAIHADLKAMK